jgi:hypothetical protein
MPFSTLISARSKPTGISLKVKVTVAVSPVVRAVSLRLMATVGGVVSGTVVSIL